MQVVDLPASVVLMGLVALVAVQGLALGSALMG
jgi:hypothetical protein